MSDFEPVVSVCRHCQHYRLEGRRGGHCSQLGSLVQGPWKACSLAIPPFAPSWESQSGITQILKQNRLQLDKIEQPVAKRNAIETLEACISMAEPEELWLMSEEVAVEISVVGTTEMA